MISQELLRELGEIANAAKLETATFDQLCEEVMELHLAYRGRHSDTPAMEWLEIATIAMNAFNLFSIDDKERALAAWRLRH